MVAKALNDMGVDVHVVGPFSDMPGATVHFFNLDTSLRKRFFLGFKASKIIRSLSVSSVVLEGPLLGFRFGKAKIFQFIHDAKFTTEHRRRGGGLLWLYYFLATRFCDSVITVSQSEKDRLVGGLRLPSKAIQISRNGLAQAWLQRQLEDKEKSFDILYVSNFAKHKGHLRLLQHLRSCKKSVAFVGGDLGTLSQCKEFARVNGMNVTFFSGLSTSELIEIYDQSRIFVFPSELEGFGIPYIEARARGLPVVSSNIPVFSELSHALGGSVVNFESSSEVLNAIQTALDAERDVPDLSSFTWESVCEDFYNILFSAK
ncbi:glycosyltransferase family 4 protein [Sagittula sp. SSi028]|uniref:glycosyltransferase family 4 protein n=1 Tax=Sagittula sp. SSi028 TaxID=3400636 RepID=UPI003AF534D2